MATTLLVATAPFAFGFHAAGVVGKKLKRMAPCAPYATVEKPSVASCVNGNTKSSLHVYDGVFSPIVCNVLQALAVERTFRQDSEDTGIFMRGNNTKLTPLEHAIDSALRQLNDTSETVEYWSRDEYMNIDAHVDIDENQLEDFGTLRCPDVSHVLYLQVKTNLKGPTCVFPGKRVGWDSNDSNGGVVDVVTVPAVQGRLLRFGGSSMHAVPCPPDRWLLCDDEEFHIRSEEENDNCEDDGYSTQDDDEVEEEIERSVLLFNTWTCAPPHGVRGDYDAAVLEGIELSVKADALGLHEEQRLAEWEADYGIDAELIHCTPRSEWRKQRIVLSEEMNEQINQIRVHLMGKQNRRIHPQKSLRLDGPVGALRRALGQETRVTQCRFRQTE